MGSWSHLPFRQPGHPCLPALPGVNCASSCKPLVVTLQLVVTELQKLGAKGGANLSALGTPEQVRARGIGTGQARLLQPTQPCHLIEKLDTTAFTPYWWAQHA